MEVLSSGLVFLQLGDEAEAAKYFRLATAWMAA